MENLDNNFNDSKKSNISKKKKKLLISIGLVIVTILTIAIISNYYDNTVKPSNFYDAALYCGRNNEFLAAIDNYKKIPGYKDSDARARIAQKRYYQYLVDTKDYETLLKETSDKDYIYQVLLNGYNEGVAYSDLKKIISKLGNYKDTYYYESMLLLSSDESEATKYKKVFNNITNYLTLDDISFEKEMKEMKFDIETKLLSFGSFSVRSNEATIKQTGDYVTNNDNYIKQYSSQLEELIPLTDEEIKTTFANSLFTIRSLASKYFDEYEFLDDYTACMNVQYNDSNYYSFHDGSWTAHNGVLNIHLIKSKENRARFAGKTSYEKYISGTIYKIDDYVYLLKDENNKYSVLRKIN